MRKNRIIAAIWITLITLIVASMVGYIVYASIEHPYFVTKSSAFLCRLGTLFFESR